MSVLFSACGCRAFAGNDVRGMIGFNAGRSCARAATVALQAALLHRFACEEQPGLYDAVRVEGHALDPLLDEPQREIRMI